jgi:hypothetical protein
LGNKLTSIYQRVLQEKIRRSLQENKQYSRENVERVLEVFSKLAYEVHLRERNSGILIRSDEIQGVEVKILDSLNEEAERQHQFKRESYFPILRVAHLQKNSTEKEYYFSHLTLQEFLVAYHLIKNFESQKEFIKSNLYNAKFMNVWIFFSGLAKDHFREFFEMFQKKQEEVRELSGYSLLNFLNCIREIDHE